MSSRRSPAGETPGDPAARYAEVRARSEGLCAPLTPEDCAAQSMPDASPAKWHLAHTTWFFETFVLEAARPERAPFQPAYRVLFNSYYKAVGDQFARPQRGLLTRPPLDEVYRYRREVDAEMAALLERGVLSEEAMAVVELGLHHEQQHQELLLTDLKHLLSVNPLHPAYRELPEVPPSEPAPLRWHGFEGGLHWIGAGEEGFAFDNERPRHRVLLEPFELASRPVTCGEYLAFMADGGYERPELWLSDGWSTVEARGWRAPLYWERRDGAWWLFTLGGLRPVREDEPVAHLSLYEADAYAQWAGARLPRESEWEVAAAEQPVKGNFVENERFHPAPQAAGGVPEGPAQLFGDVWEWTQSAYGPYPGYRAPAGAIGEYNGKFMVSQLVLRGGSCATPNSHVRASYRNFFYPDARWQLTGLRLARDAA